MEKARMIRSFARIFAMGAAIAVFQPALVQAETADERRNFAYGHRDALRQLISIFEKSRQPDAPQFVAIFKKHLEDHIAEYPEFLKRQPAGPRRPDCDDDERKPGTPTLCDIHKTLPKR
jgi:hypothetical protein